MYLKKVNKNTCKLINKLSIQNIRLLYILISDWCKPSSGKESFSE